MPLPPQSTPGSPILLIRQANADATREAQAWARLWLDCCERHLFPRQRHEVVDAPFEALNQSAELLDPLALANQFAIAISDSHIEHMLVAAIPLLGVDMDARRRARLSRHPPAAVARLREKVLNQSQRQFRGFPQDGYVWSHNLTQAGFAWSLSFQSHMDGFSVIKFEPHLLSLIEQRELGSDAPAPNHAQPSPRL